MAELKVTGNAAGAKQALDSTAKAADDLGNSAEKANRRAERSARQAAKAEKEYEAEVQKAAKAIQKKELRTKAQAEAQRRLGVEQAPQAAAGPRARRPAPVGAAPSGRAAGAVASGAGLLGASAGGRGGAILGQVGSSIGAGAGFGPAGIAAAAGITALGVAISEITAAREREAAAIQRGTQAIADGVQAIESIRSNIARDVGADVRAFGGSVGDARAQGSSFDDIRQQISFGRSVDEASAVAAFLNQLPDAQRQEAQAAIDLLSQTGTTIDSGTLQRLETGLRTSGAGGLGVFQGPRRTTAQLAALAAGSGRTAESLEFARRELRRGGDLNPDASVAFERSVQDYRNQAAFDRFANLNNSQKGLLLDQGLDAAQAILRPFEELKSEQAKTREEIVAALGEEGAIVDKLDELIENTNQASREYSPRRP